MNDMFRPPGSLRPLRPHQMKAIEGLRNSLRNGKRRPVLQAPTGFGKTLTAAHIIARSRSRGQRIIFTAPFTTLIDQTVEAFEREGISDIGVMQANHPRTDPSQPIQVCSVQTLARRARPHADLVIIDEAHRMYESVRKWMSSPQWAHVPFIGLSATPWTEGMGKYFDDLIIASTTKELIDEGFLSRFTVYAPAVPDLAGISVVAGDYNQDQLAGQINNRQLVGDIVDTWKSKASKASTLVYGVNRLHAEHIQQRFLEAGISAEYMDGETANEQRAKILQKFAEGKTKIICNVGVLTTGFDGDVRCLIDARPTKSEILYVQTIGRGLRTAPGKDRLIILDHAGNALRLGLVTDIHHAGLSQGPGIRGKHKTTPEKKEPSVRLCENCQAVMRQSRKVCSECGVIWEAKSAVEHLDGELVELGGNERIATAQDPAAFYSELKAIAKEKRYKEGWAMCKFKEKFGKWPEEAICRLPPSQPSLKTRNWVRARQIANIKSREGAGLRAH